MNKGCYENYKGKKTPNNKKNPKQASKPAEP